VVAFGLLCGSGFSLVELELSQFDSFCSAGISYPSGFVFPFALFVGVLGFETSTESLILAQDERWRRA
jgi:hypothetical protein